jgi:hypothetical protein
MVDMVQGSPEWLDARCGKATASRIADILAVKKDGKPTAERERYLMELVGERLTGLTTQHYLTGPMLEGSEREPQAADAYAFLHGADVEKVGFVEHPTIAMAGASPDRLVGDVGLVEIKCPDATHAPRHAAHGRDPGAVLAADAMAARLHRPGVVRLRHLAPGRPDAPPLVGEAPAPG